jgi:hypothetical protein
MSTEKTEIIDLTHLDGPLKETPPPKSSWVFPDPFRLSDASKAAHERAARTGESVAEAREANKLDAIRDGQGKPAGIISKLASALKGEKTAKEELEKAVALRAEAAALNLHWENLLCEHQGITDRINWGERNIQSLKGGIASAEEFLEANIGTANHMPTQSHFAQIIQDIGAQTVGIPFAERALDKVRGKFRAHVAQMREWGSKNGVPKETLAAIPG